MICTICHATLPEESRFCLSCGADMSDPSAERRPFDTVAVVQELLTGAVAGHYRVGRLLGRGGMGTVFLAEDLTLQREVAIKVLPPRLTSEEKFVARFLHEARISAKLDHPNIIPIYAVQSEGDLHYFAMKYVAGRTIDQLLEAGPMPVDECRRILADAASALAHAHQKGVVHRDVKPSNIMIDDTGRVLLTDFGISKALESATQFTGTGQLVGTPHYMSPEQAKGTRLDGRSDEYSLAVVGYQMLTGKLLFESSSAHSVIYGHINEPPPSARISRPEIPEYLDRALMKALAKQPDDRFATMQEFAAAVVPERAAEFGGMNTPAEAARRPTVAGSRRGRLAALIGVPVVALAIAIALYKTSGGAAAGSPQTPAATAQPAPPAASPDSNVAGQAGSPGPGGSQPASRVTVPPTRPAETTKLPSPTPSRPAPANPPAAAPGPAAAVGYLTLDTQPYGTLNIDGVDVGDTPVVRHALAPGTHTVRVTRDGYKTWSQTITITAGNASRVSHALEPQP